MAKNTEMDPVFLKLFPLTPRKGDLRKAQIIQATIEVIGKNGIENLSYESIGEKLNINRAHVAYYFKKKDEIIDAAIKYITFAANELTVQEILRAEGDVRKVEAIAIAAFKWLDQNPNQGSTMLAFYHLCSHNKVFKKLHSQIRIAGAERLSSLIAKIIKDGSTEELQLIGETIQAIITSNLLEYITTEKNISHDEALQSTLKQIHLMINVMKRNKKNK